ncbi:septation protein SepH [Nesterenkonia lutea]|uniref:DUF3071 domain-containing protein n=1 Tax=Nesterenkonia lutea TaxID=272919 RepID=A0ABR9JCX6_9MICC|nr:septation protein SepH [Nesterenkonia lutea]MBE1523784.1 hypothetical protein [Nesterenkonia lutea]
MQHLRIVGVDEGDGEPQLILSDDSGHEFALPVDEALRQAAARPSVRPSGTDASTNPLTPREIQSRLRSGATVDQVVAASGLTMAHVQRYAGPVQAERAYMAQRARTTQIAAASAAESHRVAFGDAPATLEAMVKVRLRAMDVDLSTVNWDAWRREDGLWQITCLFDVDSSATHGPGIGLKPPAEWVFQAETRHLRAANRWAESLSVLAPSAQASSADSDRPGVRRLSAVDTPFNVEDSSRTAGLRSASVPGGRSGPPSASGTGADAPSGASATSADRSSPAGGTGQDRTAHFSDGRFAGASRRGGESAPRGEGREHEDLLEVLRARRGQRLGADAEADDRLALMLNRQDPPRFPSDDSGEPGHGAPAGSSEGAGEPDEARDSARDSEDEHSTIPLARLRPVTDHGPSRSPRETPQDQPDSEGEASDGAEAEHTEAGHTHPDHQVHADQQRPGQRNPDQRTPGQTLTGQRRPSGESQRSALGAQDDSSAGAGAEAGDAAVDAWGFAYEETPADPESAGRTDRGSAETRGALPASSRDDETGPETEQSGATARPRRKAPARRASMPKWDDILFGSKND